jgi:hypothetical protein
VSKKSEDKPKRDPVPTMALEPTRITALVARRHDLTGSPKWVTEQGLEQIREWAQQGKTKAMIAAALRMSRTTFRECIERQPELVEALEAATVHEAALLDELSRQALEDGNTIAAIFLLKGRHGWREGETRDGAGPQVNVQIVLPGPAASVEEYNARIAARAAPNGPAEGSEPPTSDEGSEPPKDDDAG